MSVRPKNSTKSLLTGLLKNKPSTIYNEHISLKKKTYQAVKTSNVARICSHNAVNSDKPLLRTSTAGGPTKSNQIWI